MASTCDRLIVTAYSRSGLTCSAWDDFNDKVIGHATGGGYDKTHTALQHAIEHILTVELNHPIDRVRNFANGAAGFRSVADKLEALGLGYKIEIVV